MNADLAAVSADRSRFWLGTGVIALTAAAFALVTTFARIAYDGGAEPAALLFLRVLAFTVFVGGLLAARGRSLRLPARALASTGWIAGLMLVMSAGYLSSVAFIPVGLAAIILYTFPLMVGALASLAGREPMTAGKAAALVGAFIGLAFALGPTFASLDWRGVALALAAAVATAAMLTFSGPTLRMHDALVVNLYCNLWMLVAMALYLLAAGGAEWPRTTAGLVGAGGATLCYIAGFIGLFAGLRLITPVHSALMLNAEPPISILAAALLLGERLGPLQLVGVAIVLTALFATTLGGARAGAGRR